MKKFILLLWAFLVFPLFLFAQNSSQFDAVRQQDGFQVLDNTAAVGDSAKVEGDIALKLRLDWSAVCFCLRVGTRGTNDSLLVTIQTTATPSDTATWQTLTTFDGRKAAVGNTVRCFPTGTLARDSVLPLFRYIRVSQDHSIDAWTAADTSSWYLFVRPAGARVYGQ